jgi:hypothetical protein
VTITLVSAPRNLDPRAGLLYVDADADLTPGLRARCHG